MRDQDRRRLRARDAAAYGATFQIRAQLAAQCDASAKRFALADSVSMFAGPSRWVVGRLTAPDPGAGCVLNRLIRLGSATQVSPQPNPHSMTTSHDGPHSCKTRDDEAKLWGSRGFDPQTRRQISNLGSVSKGSNVKNTDEEPA